MSIPVKHIKTKEVWDEEHRDHGPKTQKPLEDAPDEYPFGWVCCPCGAQHLREIDNLRRVYASVNMESIVFCMDPSCRFSSPASDFGKTEDGTLLICPECGSYELDIEP